MEENIYEKNISDRLIALRAVNKLSLEEVAIKLGVHRETIRRYENHPKNMNIDVFIKILNVYNTNPIIFFNEIYGKMS